MSLQRRDTNAAPDLSAATIGILLGGWTAIAPESSDHGFGGGLLTLYEPDGAGFLELWTAHETFLRATAKRWGWMPQFELDGRPAFYAERVAALGRED